MNKAQLFNELIFFWFPIGALLFFALLRLFLLRCERSFKGDPNPHSSQFKGKR